MTNNTTPEIIIKPELKNIRITVAIDRITFKFRNKDDRDKHLAKCKLIAEKVKELNCKVTLRGKYMPDSGYEVNDHIITFLTSRRRQGKHCPEKYIVKI